MIHPDTKAEALSGQPESPASDWPGANGAYQEILDFLVSQPTSERIINFKVSEASQTRLQTLLEKNRQAPLSPAENAELDLYEQLDTLMGLLKVRAYGAPQNSLRK